MQRADLMREGQAAVLGGMLRHSIENALEPKRAREWAAGLGMLMLEGVRLMGRIAGDLRDGRISQREDCPLRKNATEFRTRCLRQGVLTAALLIVFLVFASQPVRATAVAGRLEPFGRHFCARPLLVRFEDRVA